MGEYGPHVDREREGRDRPALAPEAGCPDLDTIQSWWGELRWNWASKYISWSLLFVLSGFFRKIILLQLVGLVLTYNFTNCNYTKIGENYENIIFHALTEYMNETKSNKFEQIYFCYNQSDCLTKIERHTFNPAGGCRSLPKEHFALETSSTFVVCCPGYSRIQINNTQEMKQRKFKRSCQNQASQILGLWRGFIRPP